MFELSGVNYCKKHCQIQGELGLVRVNEEFELSEFELAGTTVYCCFRRTHLMTSNGSCYQKLFFENFIQYGGRHADLG